MITVKTRIGLSEIHGIGLFADQFIPRGTVTWKYDPEFDQSFTKDQVNKMTKITRDLFFKYAYWDNTINKYVLCFDDQRFVNHSDKPNVESTQTLDTALRDIDRGEEILCDYRLFDPTYFDKIGFDKNKLI